MSVKTSEPRSPWASSRTDCSNVYAEKMSARTARRSERDGFVLEARVRKARRMRRNDRWFGGCWGCGVVGDEFLLMFGVAVAARRAVKACWTFARRDEVSLFVSNES